MLDINPDVIDLWHGELSLDSGAYDNFWSVLDIPEKARAEKMTNHAQQQRYVETHGRLKYLLALYVNEAPEKIRLNKTPHGKPYLADKPEIVFNLSHSGNMMVIGVSNHCNLGVDIEVCQPRSNFSALVKKCFADEETSYWNKLPEAQKIVEFYRFWTRKEAFVKAIGRGIPLGLNSCVINPEKPTAFLRIPAECGPVSDWRLQNMDLSKNSCCAVVTDKAFSSIRLIDLDAY